MKEEEEEEEASGDDDKLTQQQNGTTVVWESPSPVARGESLGQVLRSFGDIFGDGSETPQLRVGSMVVASNDVPDRGIWQFQSYELRAVFDKGCPPDSTSSSTTTPWIETIQQTSLADPIQPGYTRYISLYSARYHRKKNGGDDEEQPVVLSLDEVGLVSMRDEVVDSVLMALPVLGFWTFVAFTFANDYNTRYGGDFMNALFRT